MKKLLLTAIAAVALISANAQDSTATEAPAAPSELSISGSVDVFYQSSLTNPDAAQALPSTSFANSNGFSLGMANVILEKSGAKSGVVADLVFGPRGDEAVFNSTGNPAILNQLYAYWNVSDNVTLTMGNFNTFLGYEVISPTANFNYTTSYMFSYGPFSHSGLKADFSLSDELSLMVGVLNPTDMTEFNPVNTYSAGVQLGYSNDNGGAWLNILAGDQDGTLSASTAAAGDASGGMYFQVDLTTGWDLSDELYLGFNTTMASTSAGEFASLNTSNDIVIADIDADAASFLGAAVYLQYALSDAFSLGMRTEYFAETNGGAGAIGVYNTDGDANVIDFTLSGQYKVGDFTLIPELRFDAASEDSFIDNDGAATSSAASFILAGVYAF